MSGGEPRVGKETMPRSVAVPMPFLRINGSAPSHLGINHVEYWKTFERPWHITVGFPWFATWPSTRRLRWPLGRRPASVLDGEIKIVRDIDTGVLVGRRYHWIATSDQCRHELTEETQNVHRIRHGYEEVHEKDTKRARWIPGVRYRRGAVATSLMLSRATLTSGNPPRGWAPSGEQIQ